MPAGQENAEKAVRLNTLSTARRQLVGQAIIDGILSPSEAALISRLAESDYDQSGGDYTQRGGGDHKQGTGNYNQASSFLPVVEEVMSVLREVGELER